MKININEIHIDKSQVLKFLGYSHKKPMPIIIKKLEEEIEKVDEYLDPKIFIKPFKITNIKDDEIEFEFKSSKEDSLIKKESLSGKNNISNSNDLSSRNKLRIKSSHVANQLKGAVCFYVCLYSIGEKIEEKIKSYSCNSEMIRALILDKIGVVALDNINYQIRQDILEKNTPYKISSQIFVNQNDFDISNQKWMLGVFEDENNTITISKHYQLNPVKTIAVIFGIGEVEEKGDMCDSCENKYKCSHV